MSQQPEALRLADELEVTNGLFIKKEAAAELRRLHAANADLLTALNALVETAEQCDGWESFPRSALERAYAVIAKVTD